MIYIRFIQQTYVVFIYNFIINNIPPITFKVKFKILWKLSYVKGEVLNNNKENYVKLVILLYQLHY